MTWKPLKPLKHQNIAEINTFSSSTCSGWHCCTWYFSSPSPSSNFPYQTPHAPHSTTIAIPISEPYPCTLCWNPTTTCTTTHSLSTSVPHQPLPHHHRWVLHVLQCITSQLQTSGQAQLSTWGCYRQIRMGWLAWWGCVCKVGMGVYARDPLLFLEGCPTGCLVINWDSKIAFSFPVCSSQS